MNFNEMIQVLMDELKQQIRDNGIEKMAQKSEISKSAMYNLFNNSNPTLGTLKRIANTLDEEFQKTQQGLEQVTALMNQNAESLRKLNENSSHE